MREQELNWRMQVIRIMKKGIKLKNASNSKYENRNWIEDLNLIETWKKELNWRMQVIRNRKIGTKLKNEIY